MISLVFIPWIRQDFQGTKNNNNNNIFHSLGGNTAELFLLKKWQKRSTEPNISTLVVNQRQSSSLHCAVGSIFQLKGFEVNLFLGMFQSLPLVLSFSLPT